MILESRRKDGPPIKLTSLLELRWAASGFPEASTRPDLNGSSPDSPPLPGSPHRGLH